MAKLMIAAESDQEKTYPVFNKQKWAQKYLAAGELGDKRTLFCSSFVCVCGGIRVVLEGFR